MQWMNVIAIIVAATMGFVVGGVWYGPLFGKKWMQARGLSEAALRKGSVTLFYAASFLCSIVAAAFLNLFLYHLQPSILGIFLFSFAIAGGFILPAFATNYMFGKENFYLFLIDAGYWLCFYTAMAGVFVLFALLR